MADSSSQIPPRCRHCSGPLSKELESSAWTISPFVRDSFSMIGAGFGGVVSAFYGFDHVLPVVQKWVKGPIAMHFLISAPPVALFSSVCAGFTAGLFPAVVQLGATAYHAAAKSPSQDEKLRKSKTSSAS